MVIVHGDKSGIGKTRFLREICLFLHERQMFMKLIQYQDLRYLTTQDKVGEFIDSLDSFMTHTSLEEALPKKLS